MSRFLVSAWLASSEQGSYEAYRAGDGVPLPDAGCRWASATAALPQTLRMDLGTAKIATWYTLTGSMYATNQDPTAWTFEGSADGTTGWTVLDTKSAQTWPVYESKSFSFANTNPYRYYRLNFSGNGGVLTSVAEVELGDNSPLSHLWGWMPTASGSGNSGNGDFTLAAEFYATIDCYITHISYFEASASSGPRTLRVRDGSGAIVASVVDTSVNGRWGWRDVAIPPVAITANTHYEAEFYTAGGYFSVQSTMPATARTYNDLVLVANGSGTVRGQTNNPRYANGNNLTTIAGSAYGVGVVTSRDLPLGIAVVEASWLEALVSGGGTDQVEASWLEALVRGVAVAQVEASWAEALVQLSYEQAGVTYASTASGIPTMTPTWAAFPGAVVKVAAAVGDWVEVGVGYTWDPGAGVFVYGDLAVVNSLNAVTRWVSTGTSSHTNGIFSLFQASGAGAYMPVDGSAVYQVQAGDLAPDGTITFALYVKTLNGNRNVNAGQGVMIWAAPCVNAPATGSCTGSAVAGWALLTGTVSVAAVAGDILEITSNALVNGSGSVYPFDAATVVAGAAVNWVSTGGSAHNGGVGAWRCAFGDFEPVGGLGVLYVVQAADVVAGNVTLQMAANSSGASATIDAASTFTVRKV